MKKKKKTGKALGETAATVVHKVKSGGSVALQFGSGVAGFGLGSFGMKKIPSTITNISVIDKLIPGLAGMGLAFFLWKKFKSNEYATVGAIGLGIAGFADAFNKLAMPWLTTQFPSLALTIGQNVPRLSGTPGYAAVNTGGVGWDYYRDNSLQGLGNAYALNGLGNAYALNGGMSMQGTSMQGTSMQGNGGAMSAANSYALNGNPYALN